MYVCERLNDTELHMGVHQYICAGARVHKKAALTPKRNKATAAVPA